MHIEKKFFVKELKKISFCAHTKYNFTVRLTAKRISAAAVVAMNLKEMRENK